MPQKARPAILVVEDDPVIRKAIQRALGGQAQVVFAPTGKAALEALSDHAVPTFILLDYMLPDMDGLQVLSKLRTLPRNRTTPVVMFSSIADTGTVRTALENGANSWVRKADDPAVFEETVQAIGRYWLELNAGS